MIHAPPLLPEGLGKCKRSLRSPPTSSQQLGRGGAGGGAPGTPAPPSPARAGGPAAAARQAITAWEGRGPGDGGLWGPESGV